MILLDGRADRDTFEAGTGWALKDVGACRGDACVPLPVGAVDGDVVDLVAVTDRLGMPMVADAATGATAVGPAVLSGGALADAAMPDLVLPDLDGRPFDVASLRGKKVVLVSWAPY